MNTITQDPIRSRAVEKIRETLRQWDEQPMAEESIHQLRVCTKRLRAFLRVYPSGLDGVAANHGLKSLADSYADLRDAQVSYATLIALISQWSDKKRKKHRAVIDFVAHQKHQREQGTEPLEPHQALEQVLLNWPQLDAAASGGEVVHEVSHEGMLRLYQKAKALGLKALQSDHDEDFHTWRKWVKYWLYCLTELSSGKVPVSYRKRLKRLGDSLGVFHDVCVLEEMLKNPDVYHEFGQGLKPFYKLIRNEKKRMKKSYKKAFKKLFKVSRRELNGMLGIKAEASSSAAKEK